MKHLSARWRVKLLLILHVTHTFWPAILHPVMDVSYSNTINHSRRLNRRCVNSQVGPQAKQEEECFGRCVRKNVSAVLALSQSEVWTWALRFIFYILHPLCHAWCMYGADVCSCMSEMVDCKWSMLASAELKYIKGRLPDVSVSSLCCFKFSFCRIFWCSMFPQLLLQVWGEPVEQATSLGCLLGGGGGGVLVQLGRDSEAYPGHAGVALEHDGGLPEKM